MSTPSPEADWVNDCFSFYTNNHDRPPTAIELWDWKRLDCRAQAHHWTELFST